MTSSQTTGHSAFIEGVGRLLRDEQANLAAAKALDAYVPLTAGAYTTQAEAFRDALRAAVLTFYGPEDSDAS